MERRQRIQQLLQSGRAAEALPLLKQQVSESPQDVLAWANLIRVCEQLNRLDEAAQFLAQVHQQGLRHPLIQLSEACVLRRQGELEKAQAVIEYCLNLTGSPIWYRATGFYEAAKIYDALGLWQKAYAAATEANGCAKQMWPKTWFSDALWRWLARLQTYRPERRYNTERAPVFLMGYPRSGTTLVHQMLDAHPAFCVVDEWPIIETLASAIGQDWSSLLVPLSQERVTQLRTHYWQSAPTHSGVLVDKLPLNMLFWPLIRALFPSAKVVIVRRHPLDAALSAFMQEFRPHPSLTPFLDMADSIAYWLQLNQLTEHILACDADLVTVIEYEDLVDKPQETLKALMDFLELPLDQRQFKFYEHAKRQTQINTPSYHQVVRPIYRSSIGRWRDYAHFYPVESVAELRAIIGHRWTLPAAFAPEANAAEGND